MRRLEQIFIAADCLANAILGGWSGETLSARSWRLRTKKPWKYLRAVLDFFVPGHCEHAYHKLNSEQYLPPEYRD